MYVDVGLGFHAQMTPAEAIAFSTQRESKLTEAAEALARCGEQPPRASSQIQHTPFQRQIKLWAASAWVSSDAKSLVHCVFSSWHVASEEAVRECEIEEAQERMA